VVVQGYYRRTGEAEAKGFYVPDQPELRPCLKNQKETNINKKDNLLRREKVIL
jgi:hypothetical protein